MVDSWLERSLSDFINVVNERVECGGISSVSELYDFTHALFDTCGLYSLEQEDFLESLGSFSDFGGAWGYWKSNIYDIHR